MEIFYVFAGLTLLGLIVYGLQIWAVRLTLKSNGVLEYWSNGASNYTNSSNHCSITPLLHHSHPPVSILKPLKGLDDNLFDNLESFCRQDYPEYEIIFSLEDYNDPAYKVASKVRDKYRDKDISIIIARCNAGLNPKVNNLIPAYKSSKYELLLISDSNVMVDKNYLKNIVKYMKDPEVGLVSNIIKGVGARTIGSVFENLHLNSFIAGSVCFLDRLLGMPCVVGKSMLMRKSDLEAIGGLKAVKDFLAEDYIIGDKMRKRGKKVILSGHMINNVNEYCGLRKFFNRHIRWGKIRWKIGGIKYFSELIGNPVFMSFLPIILWEASKVTVSFAMFVSLIKTIGDFHLGRRAGAKLNLLLYLLSPIKDLIIGLIWFVPIFSNTVVWRGHKYIIGKDSALSPCPETGILVMEIQNCGCDKGEDCMT